MEFRAMHDRVAYLEVVHGTSDGSFTDLVPVRVEDRDDSTTLCWVDVLLSQI